MGRNKRREAGCILVGEKRPGPGERAVVLFHRCCGCGSTRIEPNPGKHRKGQILGRHVYCRKRRMVGSVENKCTARRCRCFWEPPANHMFRGG